MPDQWQAVADVRERHEQRAFDELAEQTWRDRRRRMNDEIWLHGDAAYPERPARPPERQSPGGQGWVWAIIAAAVLLAWSLYVLSCGFGMCAL